MLRQHKTNKAVRYIINHLRKEDKEEMRIKYGRKWKKVLLKEHSKIEFDILVDKKNRRPFLMGAINVIDKSNPDIGGVWLLSTNDIYKHKFKVVKSIIGELSKQENKYFMIFNFIYSKNLFMKEFAKKLGFRFLSAKQFGMSEDWELIYKTKTMKGLV